MKNIIMALVVLSMLGCSTVTVRTDGKPEASVPPTYEKQYTYWWWGLKGEYSVNIREVCAGKSLEQIQTVHSLIDSLSGLFTLGIYAPRTARVWCEEA